MGQLNTVQSIIWVIADCGKVFWSGLGVFTFGAYFGLLIVCVTVFAVTITQSCVYVCTACNYKLLRYICVKLARLAHSYLTGVVVMCMDPFFDVPVPSKTEPSR